jgi:hypothetical protein
MVSHVGEGRDEPLQPGPGSKPLHHPLPFSDGNMRILCPIIQPFVAAVLGLRHDLALSGAVRGKLVGHNPFGRAPLL